MRWVAAIGIWMTVLAYAVYQGGSLSWHLLGFLTVLTLFSALWTLSPIRRLATDRIVSPGPYYAGDTLHVTLIVTAPGRWFWPYLAVEDNLPEEWEAANPRFVVRRLDRGTTRLEYRIPALKRGIYPWASVTLKTGDPVGISTRSRTFPIPGQVVVWPQTVSLPSTHLWPRRWTGENLARQLSRVESNHVRGIREYVTGDRLSHVHWRTSAHTGDFKVKQFEPETDPDFSIMLDYAAGFTEGEWELAISIAASLAQHASHTRQAIGLLVLDFPHRALAPASGTAALALLMDTLSGLRWQSTPNRTRNPHLAGRLVAVVPASRAETWRTIVDIVVPVGVLGLQSLPDLPTWLGQESPPLELIP